MKKVFNNSAEVMHIFAQKTQSEGRSSNVFFYGNDIFSYGRHYKLAEFIDDYILINDTGYSKTTSKHIAQIRQATRQYKQYFISDIDLQIVSNYIKSQYEKLLKAKKPIIYISNIIRKFDLFNEYPKNKSKNITSDIRYKEIKKIFEIVHNLSNNLDTFKETTKQLQDKEQKKQRAILNKSIKNFETYKSNFIKGDQDFLRISECGEYVETSQQVKVTIQDAKILYTMIKNKKEIRGYNIGGYIVTSINGTLKIGCHKINMQSVKKIGEKIINN